MAAVLSAGGDGVIRLVLADLPATAARPNLADARTMGGRAGAIARLKELLPGASFDQEGHGTFKRAGYVIRFTLDGPEPAMIEVEVDRAEGLTALKRVVEKTGWRAVDPEALAFVDLEASRAAGTTVCVAPPADLPAPAEQSGSSGVLKRVAGFALAALFVWGAWQWSSRPRTTQPVDSARAQRISDELIARIGDAHRRQVAFMKSVAPAFRGNPIVIQLFNFELASLSYTSGFGMGRFAKPALLSDPEQWNKFQMPAPLPPDYAEAQRDGYEFEFIGETCGPMKNNMSAPPDDCDQFVYAARPIDAPGLPPRRASFALISQDLKIHYRRDGRVPGLADPSVDNVEASSHDDLVNGGADPNGWMASLRRVTTAIFERALGDKPGSTEIGGAEGNALKDLRAFAQAENIFQVMMNGEARFLPPEAMADSKAFAPAKMGPLLPGYFAQPTRMGYVFEFTGEAVTVPMGSFDWIKTQYATFVYTARPVQPGPAGRRTLAVYPDGLVFATSEDRVPTRKDTPLGTQ